MIKSTYSSLEAKYRENLLNLEESAPFREDDASILRYLIA